MNTMNTVTFEIRPYQENYFQIWVINGEASAPVAGTYTTRQQAVEAIAGGITFAG